MKNRNNELVNENFKELLILIDYVKSISYDSYIASTVEELRDHDLETWSKFDQEFDVRWTGNHANVLVVLWRGREQFRISIMNDGRILKGEFMDKEHSCISA